MIRVLLADDHGVIRDGLGRLISALQDVELVGVAADGADAVRQCAELRPTSSSWTSTCRCSTGSRRRSGSSPRTRMSRCSC